MRKHAAARCNNDIQINDELTKEGCIWHLGFGLIRHSCFVIFVICFYPRNPRDPQSKIPNSLGAYWVSVQAREIFLRAVNGSGTTGW